MARKLFDKNFLKNSEANLFSGWLQCFCEFEKEITEPFSFQSVKIAEVRVNGGPIIQTFWG